MPEPVRRRGGHEPPRSCFPAPHAPYARSSAVPIVFSFMAADRRVPAGCTHRRGGLLRRRSRRTSQQAVPRTATRRQPDAPCDLRRLLDLHRRALLHDELDDETARAPNQHEHAASPRPLRSGAVICSHRPMSDQEDRLTRALLATGAVHPGLGTLLSARLPGPGGRDERTTRSPPAAPQPPRGARAPSRRRRS